MVAGVTGDRSRGGSPRHALAMLVLASLLIHSLADADVVDDVVVLNENDPLRAFNVSLNDNTAGACAANGPGSEVASCPCEFSTSGPLLSPVAFNGSYDGMFSYQPADQRIDDHGYVRQSALSDHLVAADLACAGDLRTASRRYTQLSDGEVDVQDTNTDSGPRSGRLSWREI